MLGTGTTGWAQAPDKAPADRAPGDRDRAPGDRDRAPGDRDRAPGDRDRAPGDRDRAPGDRDRAPGDRDRAPGGRPPMGLTGVIDLNGNGTIEADEIDMAVVSLRKLDRNKDGKITRDEIGGSASGSSRRSSGRRLPSLSSLDKDGDGKLSKEETRDRMRENFDRTDTNGDGFVDSKEFDAILQRIRSGQRPGERPGERPSRRPGGREPGEGEGGSDKPRRPTPQKEND